MSSDLNSSRGKYLPTIFSLFILINSLSAQSLTLETRIDSLLSKMTIEEKVLQLYRQGEMNTAENTRLKIPGFIMSDGPHGVRNGSATSFPVGMALDATWDPELVYRVGVGMGKEFRGKGIHQALGPVLDLTLDPRNGRSPESTGEDPYLNSKINTAIVKGIQSTGEIATIKHFYSEYSQYSRTENNYTISDKNFMEFHGLPFREVLQDAGSLSIMSAYNSVNGKQASESPELLLNILKGKWGFPYYVVSDWWAVKEAWKAITGGCDIEMGSSKYGDATSGLLALVKNNPYYLPYINESVRRVLRTKLVTGLLDYYPAGNPADINSTSNQALTLEAGKKSIVLLKNEGNILPLNKNQINKIAVIGPNANVMRTDARGSSWVDPFYKISPREGIENYLGSSKVLYAQGCDIANSFSGDYSTAIEYARESDCVIYFGGLDDTQEGEGWDRANGSIELPGKQKEMIQQLKDANPKLIVVLISGGICSVNSFINDVKGLLYGFYPGQEGGNAIAQILFGDYNPGGKLPVTLPKNDLQLPVKMAQGERQRNFDNDFGGGYRWFDKKNYTPEFPFGFGLSYTTFEYTNLSISPTSAPAGEFFQVSFDLQNSGIRRGEEIAQLYLGYDQSVTSMPAKQLRGFQRVALEPGEKKRITFTLTPNELYYYNESNMRYEVATGTFTAKVGSSSADLPLSSNFQVAASSAKPDLQIAEVKMVPPYPLEGEKVIFVASVINRGTGASPTGAVHEIIFKVDGKVVSVANDQSYSIPTGGMALICGNSGSGNQINYWTAGHAGNYTVSAEINQNHLIQETSVNNNIITSSLKVYNTPPINLALNKSVTVSSIEKAGLEGSNAVDGSLSSRWSSSFSDPQWITVDLGEKKNFNQIRLIWETAFGKEYTIQSSDDNITFNSIAVQTNGQGGMEQFIVNCSARYVKIFGTKRGTQWGYSLFEIEIFNNLDMPNQVEEEKMPLNFRLENNYPNPFNPKTTIVYELPHPGNVKIEIYNSIGQLIKVLENSFRNTGKYKVIWDGRNFAGQTVNSGVYIYRMSSAGSTLVRKMMLIK